MKNILIYIFALCIAQTSFAGQEHLWGYKTCDNSYVLCLTKNSISLKDFQTGLARLVVEEKMSKRVLDCLESMYDKFNQYIEIFSEQLSSERRELLSDMQELITQSIKCDDFTIHMNKANSELFNELPIEFRNENFFNALIKIEENKQGEV